MKIMCNPNIKGKPFLTFWGLSLSLIFIFHFYRKGFRWYALFFIENNSEFLMFYQAYFCDIISNS